VERREHRNELSGKSKCGIVTLVDHAYLILIP
jgi:hypothetical protein